MNRTLGCRYFALVSWVLPALIGCSSSAGKGNAGASAGSAGTTGTGGRNSAGGSTGTAGAPHAGGATSTGGASSIGGSGGGGTSSGGGGGGGVVSGSGANVLTHHNDNQRTGANLHETVLNTSNVNVDHFGKLYEWPVDGDIYSQPLYVSNVALGGANVRNVVYVTSMHNTVFAFDADSASKLPLWMVDLSVLGSPIPVSMTTGLDVQPGPQDIATEIGVLSTPVIDPASKTLYLVARSLESGSVHHQKLHALDLATGMEKFGGPVELTATLPGTGDGSNNGQLTFDPVVHNQRAALLLAGGKLYISWAGHNDSNAYHGWVMAYDALTLQRSAAFLTTPNGRWGGGIWQTGAGPAADANNNVYLETGNGDYDAAKGSYGDSVLKLGLSGNAINVLGSFTPKNQAYMNGIDLDLGSSGPVLIPGSPYVLASGKEGKMYLLDTASLGGYSTTKDSVVDEFQATPLPACDPHCTDWYLYFHIHAAPVFWHSPDHGPLVYVWAERDNLKAFRFLTDHMEHTPVAQSPMPAPPGMPGGFLSLSANGSTAGTGIVWALHPVSVDGSATDASESGVRVRGILQAFDASDVSKELYNSRMNAARDDFGNFAKFNVATVANGKVFVPTMSKTIAVFGLKSSG